MTKRPFMFTLLPEVTSYCLHKHIIIVGIYPYWQAHASMCCLIYVQCWCHCIPCDVKMPACIYLTYSQLLNQSSAGKYSTCHYQQLYYFNLNSLHYCKKLAKWTWMDLELRKVSLACHSNTTAKHSIHMHVCCQGLY